MMHLYKDKDKRVEFQKVVLILVVMDDALVRLGKRLVKRVKSLS